MTESVLETKTKKRNPARWDALRLALDDVARPLGSTAIVPQRIDVDKIIDGLYLGCLNAAYNSDWLTRIGITHVVSAVVQKPKFHSDAPLMEALHIPVVDQYSENIYQHFETTSTWIQTAINKGGRVLVHCHAGVSRSSTLVCAYLMVTQKMSAEQALAQLREKRHHANPNGGFYKQLEAWQIRNDLIVMFGGCPESDDRIVNAILACLCKKD